MKKLLILKRNFAGVQWKSLITCDQQVTGWSSNYGTDLLSVSRGGDIYSADK